MQPFDVRLIDIRKYTTVQRLMYSVVMRRLRKAQPATYNEHRSLKTTSAVNAGDRAMYTLPINKYSPWVSYTIIYKLFLGGKEPTLVCERRGISFELVDIRTFKTLSEDQIKILRRGVHPNLLAVHEIFDDINKLYVVYEHVPRSLAEAVGNPYLNTMRLAAIIGQVRALQLS